jgi:phosphotransferase system IIB component
VIKGTIDAVGGVENIKLIHSGTERLVLSLYDNTKLNVAKLLELGAIRVTETKAGYAIGYGSSSTMIRIGITKYMRDNIRSA